MAMYELFTTLCVKACYPLFSIFYLFKMICYTCYPVFSTLCLFKMISYTCAHFCFFHQPSSLIKSPPTPQIETKVTDLLERRFFKILII